MGRTRERGGQISVCHPSLYSADINVTLLLVPITVECQHSIFTYWVFMGLKYPLLWLINRLHSSELLPHTGCESSSRSRRLILAGSRKASSVLAANRCYALWMAVMSDVLRKSFTGSFWNAFSYDRLKKAADKFTSSEFVINSWEV